MSAPLEQTMSQAAAALSQSRWDEAASLFMAAIRQQPSHRPAWHGLVFALARGDQLALIPTLADWWRNMGGDRLVFLDEAFTVLLGHHLLDAALGLAALFPATGAEELPCRYAEACVHILRDDEDRAFVPINRFKALAALYRDSLPIGAEDAFNIAYRQATLVEDLPYVAALMAAPPPPDPPRLRLLHPPRLDAAAGHVMVASCNGLYFDIFAEAYCRAIDRTMDGVLVHLHVMEPEPGSLERAESLAATLSRTVLNISWEPSHPRRGRSYFASNRFLIAPQLLDLYGRDLLISDVDIEFTTDMAPLIPRLAGQDFACYAYAGFGPASRYIAYLTWFSQAHGRAIADVVGRFVHSKLHIQPPHSWMLDQAALISGLRWLRRNRPDLVIGRMNELFGRPADSLFRMQERDAAKDAAIEAVVGT